jgi:predicted GH43/DUF377 family glycosyl hydrolase
MLKISVIKLSLLIIFIGVPATNIHPQINWSRYDNPVLMAGGPGSWDENFSVVNSVLFHEGIYKMWYEGDNGFGYATSVDEINWIKDTLNNPVMLPGPPGSWDEKEIANASVIFIDDTFHLWYSGKDVDNDNRIGHAISLDGIYWQKDTANPVLDLGDPGSLDDHELIHPFVMYAYNKYWMYYNGHDGTTQRIVLATSIDKVNWDRYYSNPILDPGPEEWDSHQLGPTCVVVYQDTFRLFYTGLKPDTTARIGYAFSTDGYHYTKYADNPVLDFGEPGRWDDAGVALPYVIVDEEDSLYKMWYGGSDSIIGVTGYATSDLLVSVEEILSEIPERFVLYQNYPNPFNPSTKISFTIPQTGFTSLKVYGVLGNQVATLVDEEKVPGTYEVEYTVAQDSSPEITSGVYFYQLKTESFIQTKKMLLLR